MGIKSNGEAFGDRSDSPNSKGRGAYYKQWQHIELGSMKDGFVDMAWHHAIPWNQLRDVWTRMIQDQQWDLIETWLVVIGIAAPSAKEMITDVKKNGLGGDDQDLILERLTWSTWNIVEGPKHRVEGDDPGERYDDFHLLLGLSTDERAQMKAVDILSTVMNAMNLSAKVEEARVGQLKKALLAIPFAAPIIKFNPESWRKMVDVQGRLMQDSNQPKWKKRNWNVDAAPFVPKTT